MLVSILCSGSEGNSTLIQTKDKKILIDIGMNNKYIVDRLAEVNVKPDDIDYVFITHTHKDHIGAMKVFFKKNKPVVILDEQMLPALPFLADYQNLVFDKGPLNLGSLTVEIFKTSHDAPGSRGYIFKEDDASFVYVTDTGYINQRLFDKLSNHSLYVFESNHDVEMLMHGNYPAWLKARVRGDEGHLSNQQSLFYLSKFIGPKTKQIVLAHISKENNDPNLALDNMLSGLKDNNIDFQNIIIAKQHERVDCVEI